jgi:hypothetical protein
MKRFVVMILVACGSKSPAPAQPVENTAPPTQVEPGAADAREIQRTAQGGVIELTGDRGPAMRAADRVMEQRCGKDAYTITQEGEEAILNTGTNLDDGPPTTTETAWRVHYACAQR